MDNGGQSINKCDVQNIKITCTVVLLDQVEGLDHVLTFAPSGVASVTALH